MWFMNGIARMDESLVSSDDRMDARCLADFSGYGRPAYALVSTHCREATRVPRHGRGDKNVSTVWLSLTDEMDLQSLLVCKVILNIFLSLRINTIVWLCYEVSHNWFFSHRSTGTMQTFGKGIRSSGKSWNRIERLS